MKVFDEFKIDIEVFKDNIDEKLLEEEILKEEKILEEKNRKDEETKDDILRN